MDNAKYSTLCTAVRKIYIPASFLVEDDAIREEGPSEPVANGAQGR